MTADEYLALVEQYVDDYDRPAVIRSFQRFCKEKASCTDLSADAHVQRQLPSEDAVRVRFILSFYGEPSPYEVEKAVKWFRQNHIPVQETLCGPCVTEEEEKKLRFFLENAIPAQSEFERFCTGIHIKPTPAMFASFRRDYGGQLVATRHHPYSAEQYFWTETPEKLYRTFGRWYSAFSASVPSTMDGHLSVCECAEALGVTPNALLDWLEEHTEAFITHSGQCLIPLPVMRELQRQWTATTPVLELLIPKLNQLPAKSRIAVKQSILTQLQEHPPSWILPADSLPQQAKNALYTASSIFANQDLDDLISSIPALPLQRLKDITGMSLPMLRKKAANGAISAATDDSGNYHISIRERNRIHTVNEQYIPLDDIVLSCPDGDSGLFQLKHYADRENLIVFCEGHDWWELDCVPCEQLPLDGKLLNVAVLREDAEELKDHIWLWLRGYQQVHSVKFKLLTSKFQKKFPFTTATLLRFEKQVRSVDSPLLDMAQLLYLTLSAELKDMSDTQIEHTIITRFQAEATLCACNVLSAFLTFGRFTKRNFSFSRIGFRVDTLAYSVRDFATIIGYIVNDNIIRDANLISKAVADKKFADLWLFIALHVFAAWRTTDYIRMLPPRLPYPPEEILKKVSTGELTSEETSRVASNFIATNRLVLDTPNKTKGTPGVPRLYFFCPESCLEVFGTILTIAAAHNQITNADCFIRPVKDWLSITQFFGEDFLQACGNKSFSGRRANKALLQSIEYSSREDAQMPPLVAYNLASIMRSHKLSYGTPSETTAKYLNDANFSGLTPEFVAYQMWERGVCSFVTDAMLQICYGEEYKCFAISQQTAVISGMELTPANVSSLLRQVQDAQDRACTVVAETFQSKGSIEKALKAIALGHGVGKNPEGFCLCKAADMPCRHPERLSCLGCRFEICTKALLLRYAAIHQQLAHLTDKVSDAERNRRRYLCEKFTYPAIFEILSHLKEETAETEFSLFKDLLQEVTTYRITDSSLP